MTRVAIAILGVFLGATSSHADTSHWKEALTHLSRAEQALGAAASDKGGYRKGALEQVYKAENEVQQALQGAHDAGSSSGAGKVKLDDLVGAKGSSFESAITSRGFSSTGGYKDGGGAHSTWHNAKTHQCVAVVTSDGRVQSIEAIDENNCL